MISRFGWLYCWFVLAAAAVQVAAGAHLFILACVTIIALCGVIPMSRARMTAGDALFFAMAIYFGAATLAIKDAVFQPLQMNLIEPETSAAYLLIGFSSITAAYLLASLARVRIGYFDAVQQRFRSVDFLARWTRPVFLIGFAFYTAHTLLRANVKDGAFEEGGFGGFGAFYPLFLLGIAMQVGLCVARPKARTELAWLVVMGVAAFGLSSAGNVKRVVLDYLVVLVISYFAYRIRLRGRTLAAGGVLALAVVFYFQPAIQIVRGGGATSVAERIPRMWEVIADSGFDPIKLSDEADVISTGYKASYGQSYIYPVPWNTERYTMILPVDEVTRTFAKAGPLGLDAALHDLARDVLPSFLIDKVQYALGDEIAWRFGFRDSGIIGRPVVGLVASSLGVLGPLGIVFLPGLMAALAFVTLDAVGGRIAASPFGVFVAASNLILAERDITLISYFLRDFLILLGFVALLMIVSGSRPGMGGKRPFKRRASA